MMHETWIYVVTLLASMLTLVAGFGLGTILTPVFTLFYDVKLAILLVAIVHFVNNALKFLLFRKYIDLSIIKRFGLLSVVGSILGAALQLYLQSDLLKVFLGILLIVLGLVEFLPEKTTFKLPQKIDVIGGFFSGLLGGLVGNQGAIRSAYLLNYDISKEAFIATATVIALTIDATRIPVYLTSHQQFISEIHWQLLLVVTVALIGTLVGKKLLTYFSIGIFKKVVAGFVVLMGISFALRLI
ncbi:MAG: sulfite exporter TauE/SafE family protein [Ignavibacteria bacterium]|nr:sulfite exporter TauE/SafE family protein [Ignavibacteria bacterium]